MAKLFGEIDTKNILTLDKSFSRSEGQPLDSTQVHYSYQDALDYAKTNAAYVGQILTLVTDNLVSHYTIKDIYGNIEPINYRAKVFDTEAEMNSWIDSSENVRGDVDTAIGWNTEAILDYDTHEHKKSIIYAVDSGVSLVRDKNGDTYYQEPNGYTVDIQFDDGYSISEESMGTNSKNGRIYVDLTSHLNSEEFRGKVISSIYVTFDFRGWVEEVIEGPSTYDSNPTVRAIDYGESTDSPEALFYYNIPLGTNLYIRETGVPDYWWDGVKALPLETKVDLTAYAKTEYVDTEVADVRVTANEALSIAKGASKALVFNTEDEMNAALFGNAIGTTITNGTHIVVFVKKETITFTDTSDDNTQKTTLPDTFVFDITDTEDEVHNIETYNKGECTPIDDKELMYVDLHIYSTAADAGYYSELIGKTIKDISDITLTLTPGVYIDFDNVIAENVTIRVYSEDNIPEKIEDLLTDTIDKETLSIGTNLYIRDVGVPDYWWDGSKPCELETKSVVVDNVVTKDEFEQITSVIDPTDGTITIGGRTLTKDMFDKLCDFLDTLTIEE